MGTPGSVPHATPGTAAGVGPRPGLSVFGTKRGPTPSATTEASETRRISVTSAGKQSVRGSATPVISADGLHVAFTSVRAGPGPRRNQRRRRRLRTRRAGLQLSGASCRVRPWCHAQAEHPGAILAAPLAVAHAGFVALLRRPYARSRPVRSTPVRRSHTARRRRLPLGLDATCARRCDTPVRRAAGRPETHVSSAKPTKRSRLPMFRLGPAPACVQRWGRLTRHVPRSTNADEPDATDPASATTYDTNDATLRIRATRPSSSDVSNRLSRDSPPPLGYGISGR